MSTLEVHLIVTLAEQAPATGLIRPQPASPATPAQEEQ